MPRQPRHLQPAMTYHLISRFVDREWFIQAEHEREHYLRLLGRALAESDWRVFSYAIMSNHIHLGLVAGEQPLAQWVRRVHTPFADSMNRTYGRIGVMFVRGPKMRPVPPENVGALIAYHHNNPVRAGLCANASGSDWTSHRAYVGTVPCPSWLHVEEGLARAGFDDRRAFSAWIDDPQRAATDASFTEEHYRREAELAHELDTRRVVSAQKVAADRIVVATADALGVSVETIRSKSRGEIEVLARTVAVHSAMTVGLSGSAIAGALAVSSQRVSTVRRQELSEDLQHLCAEVCRRAELPNREFAV